MNIEDIKEAIEVLEDASAEMLIETGDKDYYSEAIAILRQAIEQSEQEPVLWLKTWSDGSVSVLKTKSHAFADRELEPLYSAPPPRKPLTDEEIETIANDFEEGYVFLYRSFARAIESAHGIGEKA